MIEKYTNWFWDFFSLDPSVLEKLSPAQQSLLELLPYVIGIVVILSFFVFLLSGRGEEPEKVALTALDKEIEYIKRLQKKL